METFWFVAVAAVLTIYVVLDGFDFGTGIVYLWVARTESERRTALRAIGPVWNGNEVWLIAAGGLIFFAFPRAYAAGFSGFYLALMLVLWLLMFRGLAIELRSHLAHPLWHAFWDVAFAGASLLLAIVFGAALGNLLRGVPLNQEGYFFTPFWTTFTVGPAPGILDWFTGLMALTGAAILTMHGAQYLAMKTDGDLAHRAGAIARAGSPVTAALVIAAFAAIPFVQPALRRNYDEIALGDVLPMTAVLALASLMYFQRTNREVPAFAASSAFIAALLGSAAFGLYPNLLLATGDPSYSLTIRNSSAGPYGLTIGLVWFSLGLLLAFGYMVALYRAFRGKIRTSSREEADHY